MKKDGVIVVNGEEYFSMKEVQARVCDALGIKRAGRKATAKKVEPVVKKTRKTYKKRQPKEVKDEVLAKGELKTDPNGMMV